MYLYFMRHAASQANEKDILASILDYPLSEQGEVDAKEISQAFLRDHKIQYIFTSPLKRAKETALPFAKALNLPIVEENLLIEQNLGIYAGKTYSDLESEGEYEHDRTKRWMWIPKGGGESYQMIAQRVNTFFSNLDKQIKEGLIQGDCLIVSHAVTLRLVKAVLEDTLPLYPEKIASNGEIWQIDYNGLGIKHKLKSLYYGEADKRKFKA